MFSIDNDKKISKQIWTKKQYQKMEDDMYKTEKFMNSLYYIVILNVVVIPIILLIFFG